MKKLVYWLLIMLSLQNTSCKKDDVTSPIDMKGVYIVGTEFTDGHPYPVLWKDGIKSKIGIDSGGAYSIYIQGTDIYVAGTNLRYGYKMPALWKNGTDIMQFHNFGEAYSVYVKDTTVYVAGFEMVGAKSVPNLWINNKSTHLSLDFGVARSVYLSNNDVYVGGILDIVSKEKAVYWKNGNLNILYTNNGGQCMSILVKDTNVYCAGTEIINNSTPRNNAYWKNGVLTNLGTDGYITSIAISDTNVYFAGYCYERQTINNQGPTIWKNGNRTRLSNNRGSVNSIAVLGNDIIAVGSEYISNINYPVIWQNGTRLQLSSNNGEAQSIFIVQ